MCAKSKNTRVSAFGSRFTSTASVTLVLILVSVASMLGITGHYLASHLRANAGFTVKMEYGAHEAELDSVASALHADEAVASVVYRSPDDILAQERAYLGDSIAAELDINPYCAEFEVKAVPVYAHTDSIAVIAARYASMEGVDEIVSQNEVLDKVDHTIRQAEIMLGSVAVVLLIISVILINNTVSLAVYSRRFIIHTMKLVGATAAFIRRPFIISGTVNGLVAGIVASALTVLAAHYAGTVEPLIARALDAGTLTLLCLCLTAGACLICTLTSWFAANRYISISYEDLFLD